MANREIIAVEIDDSAFQDFLQKFNEHQEIMKSLPSYWAAVSKEVEKQKTNFEKISAKVSASAQSAAVIEKAQEGVGKLLDGAAISFGLLSTHGKHFAANIHRSTQELMKWTKLTSVFSGLLGAGGLYGISRMATSAAGQRTSAMGLGVSYTEQASFLTNFQRLGNPADILQGFSEGLSTPIGKAQIRHLLGHQPIGDAAETASEAILKFKEFVDKTPDDQLKKRLEALGYTNLGLGVEQAKVIRGIPREVLEGSVRDYREGKTSALALDPAMSKKWTDFTTQMELASWQIENVFAKDLVKLTPGLTHLSDSFVHLVDNLLKDGSPIKGWVDSLGKGLDSLGKSMGGQGFQAGVSTFIRVSADMGHLVERITTMSLKDVLAGMGRGMDSSRADIEQRYGKDWHWYSGFTGGGGGGSTGKGYGSHGAGDADQRTGPRHDRGGTGSSTSRDTPGSRSSSTTPAGGAPLGDATHHPARYQGTLSVDGQTFDYASGSANRGRGSSPFGEHPITNFDPAAMHGRGGGAFRTQDVYDSQTGDKRGAVEIHMSNQDDVNRVETAGCYGIPRSEWPAAKAAIQHFMALHPEGATLRVRPDGRAEIVSRNEKASSNQVSTGKAPSELVSAGIKAKDPQNIADVAEKLIGLHDRNPRERALLKQYLATGGHGMDPADVNWCASFVSATLHHAGFSDIPKASGGDVALSYMNWGTKVSPDQVRRGDIMIGGTQGHKPGERGGHIAIVTGSEKGGRIPIVEGDQRDDVSSYLKNPGSVYSKVKSGPEYSGGHNVNVNTVGAGDEGLMFRRPPAVGTHPADLERGKPTGVDVVDHTGSSTSIDIH